MPDGCNNTESKCLTEEDAKLLVKQTMIALGVDLENPLEFQADTQFLRRLRQTHERISSKIVLSVVGVFVMCTVSLVVLGFVEFIRSKVGH